MADQKISQLTSLAQNNFADGDMMPIVDVDANETKKTTVGELDDRWSVRYETLQVEPNNLGGGQTNDSKQYDIDPLQASPNESWNFTQRTLNIDPNDTGFNWGTAGTAGNIINLGITHHGDSNTGHLNYIMMNSSIGDGTNTPTIEGINYLTGFGNIDAGVTVDTFIQGYGFQVNMDAASTMNGYVSGFYDSCNFQNAVNSYVSFSGSPTIADVTNNHNVTGINLNPTITNMTGNAGYNGLSMTPNIAAMDTGTFNGVYVNPTLTGADFAYGAFIDMSNATATNKFAFWCNGDVSINGALSFSGALSIGKLTAYATQNPMVNGGGNPTTIHGLVTAPTSLPNATTANCDTIGVNTAMLFTLEANSILTSGPFSIGATALAFPSVIVTKAGGTLDFLGGALFALNFDGSSTGGTIDQASGARSVAVPNGITTVNRFYNYWGHLPFGVLATDNWGIYLEDAENNYIESSLIIGGTPGSDDKVTNSSVALEIKSTTKAFLPSKLTNVQRNALTPVEGMIIYNTDTQKHQGYDGTNWHNFF